MHNLLQNIDISLVTFNKTLVLLLFRVFVEGRPEHVPEHLELAGQRHHHRHRHGVEHQQVGHAPPRVDELEPQVEVHIQPAPRHRLRRPQPEERHIRRVHHASRLHLDYHTNEILPVVNKERAHPAQPKIPCGALIVLYVTAYDRL